MNASLALALLDNSMNILSTGVSETNMSDQNLTCVDCGKQFTFTESEQEFYQSKGFSTPGRCPACRAARKAAREGTPLASTGIFVIGYVVIWSLFSLGATIAQWALDRMALLSPMMMSNSPILGGLLLLTAGIYQLTPAKDACLRHCRSPVDFVSSHWKPGGLGALRMGIEHGGFCLGCCWTLMGLLFFGGVMSLWWIGGLTLFVLLEKVMPFGAIGGRLIGGIVAVWGLMALIQFLET